MFRGKINNIHFVGIGGSGMSGIAEVLINMGYTVTGSDQRESAVIERLKKLGGKVFQGHDESHIAGADVVVKSTAVPMSNPEIQAAEIAHVPVIPRAEMLAELMRMKYGVAVAGTHGKTTTTSMLATCMHAAQFDPTVVIGGRLNSIGSSARLGMGDFMVAEADESDGSFMMLSPTVAIITNIDPEHMEHWKTEQALIDGFVSFAQKVPFFGFAALCLDHPVVQSIIPHIKRKVITYGLSAQADVRADNIRHEGVFSYFQAHYREVALGEIKLAIPGQHNISNALASIAVCLELGAPFDVIQRALYEFSGVERRFSIRAEKSLPQGGVPVVVIDDYGHHPVEIQATLHATKQAWPNRRIIAIFQPHRYTRVRDLFTDFCRSFNHASHVIVCPVYAAGEQPIDGIDRQHLAVGIAEHGHRSVQKANNIQHAEEIIWQMIQPGDVILSLGAGNVNQICYGLRDRLHG